MDAIQVAIGICDEVNDEPMTFMVFDEGVKFGSDYTRTDIVKAVAVFRDLADALAKKAQYQMN